MNITIKATNIKLTEAIEAYVEKRFAGLEKFLKGENKNIKCAVEIGKTTSHHKHGDIFRAEINLYVKPKSLYSSEEKEDLYVAIDLVKEEIERQLLSVKNKKITETRKGGAKIKNVMKNLE
ncbi:MAG: ribosome-associated translation inhibitor RaiA [Candidatus Taylorbacteria bacterium]|nr:ribosome-associated translation inhibitor RaiA [Candidatus Taylorbacteria bacterium]